ncbi:methionine synthase [Jiella endophytica]|uniref:Methionine synthase n=1 Tax=Jiella endophytica TaxID=2558362 RepID=A0A4Y8RR12_9HYPH|nr:homocysteine S-methyltransferase family protein [Jiella endophytica]TFF25127.1 methionine synthase [Jiella endophytica]
MSRSSLDRLCGKRPLLADGAMGTNLFAAGLPVSQAPESWLEERPDAITALHQGFVHAGCDLILSCSFGANRPRLSLWGAEARCFALNRRAGELARAVANEAPHPVLVAGSVGPTWQSPSLSEDEATEVFAEQMAGLKAGDVDLVWLETMATASEARAVARAAIGTGLSYVATASFGAGGLSPAGMTPAEFASAFEGLASPPLAIGANCCEGPRTSLAAAAAMPRGQDIGLAIKANCGLPQVVDGRARHPLGPAEMAAYAGQAFDAGASLIGACCGATPDHLAAMRKAFDERK